MISIARLEGYRSTESIIDGPHCISWGDFIYSGKTWNGKKYPFTNVKIPLDMKHRIRGKLFAIQTSSSNVHLLPFVRDKRWILPEGIQTAKAKFFSISNSKILKYFQMDFFANFKFCHNRRKHFWKLPVFQSQYLFRLG